MRRRLLSVGRIEAACGCVRSSQAGWWSRAGAGTLSLTEVLDFLPRARQRPGGLTVLLMLSATSVS